MSSDSTPAMSIDQPLQPRSPCVTRPRRLGHPESAPARFLTAVSNPSHDGRVPEPLASTPVRRWTCHPARTPVRNAATRPATKVQRDQRRPVLQLGLSSEEHTSELQSLIRISYHVFCLK